jgi:hypothetical protein
VRFGGYRAPVPSRIEIPDCWRASGTPCALAGIARAAQIALRLSPLTSRSQIVSAAAAITRHRWGRVQATRARRNPPGLTFPITARPAIGSENSLAGALEPRTVSKSFRTLAPRPHPLGRAFIHLLPCPEPVFVVAVALAARLCPHRAFGTLPDPEPAACPQGRPSTRPGATAELRPYSLAAALYRPDTRARVSFWSPPLGFKRAYGAGSRRAIAFFEGDDHAARNRTQVSCTARGLAKAADGRNAPLPVLGVILPVPGGFGGGEPSCPPDASLCHRNRPRAGRTPATGVPNTSGRCWGGVAGLQRVGGSGAIAPGNCGSANRPV